MRLSQFALLLKRRGFWLELKRGERAQVRTEMVDFIALPFPFPSKLKIWSFHVVVEQQRQRNVQKSVMHVQSCCFLTFSLPSSWWFRKVPIRGNPSRHYDVIVLIDCKKKILPMRRFLCKRYK